MKHFIIFYHMLALIVGISAITVTIFMQIKYKDMFFKVYALFLSALFILIMEQSFTAYQLINQVEDLWIRNGIKYISWLSSIALTYISPLTFHLLVEPESWKKRKMFFQGLLGISIILFIQYVIKPNNLSMRVANTILFSSILYSIGIVIRYRKRIKNREISNLIKVIIGISVLFFPMMYVDTITEHIPFLATYFPYGLLSVPSFYLIWNMVTLYWVVKYIQQKELFSNEANMKSSEEQLDILCDKYRITRREKQVIQLLVNGYSYNHISEALTISLSTVKTHIRNIYSKTEVKNKVELINLLNQ